MTSVHLGPSVQQQPSSPGSPLVCLTCTERLFVVWRPGTGSVISTAKIGVYEMPLCLHVFSWPGYRKGWQGGSSWRGEHRLGVFVCVVGRLVLQLGRPAWEVISIWNGSAAELLLVNKAHSACTYFLRYQRQRFHLWLCSYGLLRPGDLQGQGKEQSIFGKGRSFWMAAVPDGLEADYQVIEEPGPFS